MDKILIDIWPFIVTATFGAVGWLWKKVLNMSETLAVLENSMKTCRTNMSNDLGSLKEKVVSERDQIYNMIDKIQKRQDSHSQKQDELVKLITELKVEMLKQIGDMTAELSVIGNEVKNINRSFGVFDSGVTREAVEDDDEIRTIKARIKKCKNK